MLKNKNLQRLKTCPKFNYCNAPKCPLDEFRDLRVYKKGDPLCTLPKEKRTLLGKDLPWGGLTAKEFSGNLSWKIKDEISKSETIKNLCFKGQNTKFAPRKNGELLKREE